MILANFNEINETEKEIIKVLKKNVFWWDSFNMKTD